MINFLSKMGQFFLAVFAISIVLINVVLGYTGGSFYGQLADFGNANGIAGAIIGGIVGLLTCGVLLGPIATIYAIRSDLDRLVALTTKIEQSPRMSINKLDDA